MTLKPRKCAECATVYQPTQVKGSFCTPACKQTFHNRNAKRGKKLVPLVMAHRTGRSSPTAKRAHVEWCNLVSRFNEEDKAAGRMTMHEFVRVQYALGLRGD